MLLRYFCAIFALLCFLPCVRAATPIWQADPSTPASWFDPGNWSTNTLPTSTDTPQINNGQALISTGSATIQNLQLASNPGDSSSLSLTGGQLTTLTTYVGYSGSASINQSARHLSGMNLYISYNSKSSASYTLSGPSTLTFSNEYLDPNASIASFTQSGGVNTAYSLYLAGNNSSNLSMPNSSAAYTLSSGQLSSNTEYIGYIGNATFTQTGGSNFISSNGAYPYLFLAYYSGSSASYILSGNASLSAYHEYIGYGGAATFIQSSGTNTSNDVGIGNSSSPCSYTMSDSAQLSTTGLGVAIGTNSNASFTQTNGTVLINSGNLMLASGPYSSATYTLSGGLITSSGGQSIGSTGAHFANAINSTATFIQTGGTFSTGSQSIYLAEGANSFASYSLSDGSLSTGIQYLAYTGEASFDQSGGINHPGVIYLGYTSTAVASYSLSAGSLFASNEYIGYAGSALFSQSGGTNDLGAGTLYLGFKSTATSLYLLSSPSATLLANSEDLGTGSPSTFRQSAGLNSTSSLTIHPLSTYELSGGSLHINSSLSNSGSLNLLAGSLSTPSLTGTGTTTIFPAFSLTTPSLRQSSLSLAGSLTLTSPAADSLLTTLTTSPGSQLDLTTSTLLLNYTTSSPTDNIRHLLQNHTLLSTSSNAAHSLAYFELSLLPTNSPQSTTARSAGADSTTLIITLALTGDANLDGKLTPDDYAILDRSSSQHLTSATWTQGDFNYDGIIDQSDYLLLDTAYLSTQSPTFNPASLFSERESQFGATYVSQLIAYVPEPASPFACLFAIFLLLPRHPHSPIER